jgi:DNA-binding LacI/PurR family transcriptional regulator
MALRDTGRISPETKARIKRIAAEMNYRPNNIARSLTAGRSTLVAVVVAPAALPMFHLMMRPIEEGLQKAGYSMILYSATSTMDGQLVCTEQLLANRVAGVIVVAGSYFSDSEGYKELVDAGLSVVVISRRFPGLAVPQIACDDYKIAKLATEYLISLGHRRIGHLTIPMNTDAGLDRARGFESAMSDAGIPVNPDWVVETDLSEDAGFEAMSALLKTGDEPTAVITRHDAVAIGAMQGVFSAGKSVPDDISIVGNGEIWRSDMLRVPLTTIRHPTEKMAALGVERLLRSLAGDVVPPETEMLDVELIVRSSCQPILRKQSSL